MRVYDIDKYFDSVKGKFKLKNNITEEDLIVISEYMEIDALPFRKRKIIEHYYNMNIIHGYM